MKKPFTILFSSYIILTALLLISNYSAEARAGGAFILAFGAVIVMLVITLSMVHQTTINKNERIRKYIGLGLILIFMLFGLFTFFR